MRLGSWIKRHQLVTALGIVLIVLIGSGYLATQFLLQAHSAESVIDLDFLDYDSSIVADYEQSVQWGREGLPLGAQAPAIEGLDFSHGNTTLVFIKKRTWDKPTSYTVLREMLDEWSMTIENLRLAIIVSGSSAESLSEPFKQALKERAVVIIDPWEEIRRAYRLENSNQAYLVNHKRKILYRSQTPRSNTWRTLEDIVRSFSNEGQILEGAIMYPHPDSVLGARVPLFDQLEDLDGNPADIAPFLGKPSLVYLFSPGCEPCLPATHAVAQLFEEFKQEFHFVGVVGQSTIQAWQDSREYLGKYREFLDPNHIRNLEEIPTGPQGLQEKIKSDKDEIQRYAQEYGLSFPMFLDWNSRVTSAWGMGLYGWPSLALLDAEGRAIRYIPCLQYGTRVDGKAVNTVYPPLVELRQMIQEILETQSDSAR